MLSKTIFRLIDGLVLCANKLCGIDTINFNGEETDFMMYLFFSDEVAFAFRVSAILATMLVIVFTVFMIIRTIAKDKNEGTPAQIAVKAFKTIVMFFLVPAVMLGFMTIGNAFVKALYEATSQGAATPGAFLFSMFAADGGMQPQFVELFKTGELDYTSTALVSNYMSLSNFPYLFSWLAGGVVLFGIGSAMLIFVDRVLSLVILYIAAPISVSTSMIDDGARFKLWRDQFLSKFIMGYGMIIAINIYALVCSLVMSSDVVFFPGEGTGTEFLNMIMKLLIIAGGALTMQKSMAVVGNLVSQGAGSNELRDNMSAGALAKMVGGAAMGVAGKALGAAGSVLGLPFKPLKDNIKDAYSLWSRNKAEQWLSGKKGKNGEGKDDKGDSGSANNDKPEYGNDNKTKDAINGGDFKTSFDTPNDADKSGGKKKDDNPVNTAIENKSNNGNNQQNSNNNGQNNTNQNPTQDQGGGVQQ